MWGDAMPEFTYSMSGLVVGDTESVITTAPAFACDASDTNTAGDYTITPSNADAGDNYTITYKSGTLTIQNRSSSTGTTRYTVTIEDMDNGEVTSSPSRASRRPDRDHHGHPRRGLRAGQPDCHRCQREHGHPEPDWRHPLHLPPCPAGM